MKILALEFSSVQRSVAVLQTSSSAQPSVSEIVETGGRTVKPIRMIEAALKQAKLEREQIECVAIGLGPGSYNGIRIAIALAQGWQLASNARLLGISSAEAIATNAATAIPRGRFNVVIDAQRNEFYLAEYEVANGKILEAEKLKLISLLELQQRHQNVAILVGPEINQWIPSGKVIFPRAETIAKLALTRHDYVPGEQLTPIYLRETSFVKAPPPRFPNPDR